MSKDQSRYGMRGVSSGKEDVHAAIQNLNKGLFPGAFCKILPDILGNDANWCNLIHADGAGTKSSLAYMYWKETGDISVWRGIAQDALVMNLDDLACAGVTSNMIISSTIGRNKNLIPGEVIREIIEGTEEVLEKLNQYGAELKSGGGETADVGDLVRTIIVDSTICARARKNEIVDNHRIIPGDVIIGIASSGKATYETEYNSGIGSNGLTSARHDTFSNEYASKYPEAFDPSIPESLVFSGRKKLTESADVAYKIISENKTIHETVTIGKLVLSPTRTYLPFVHLLKNQLVGEIHGLIHCTGGGQTKVLNFINNLNIVKNNLFAPPEIFQIIKTESSTPLSEMYRVFNMGHRLEVYCAEKHANEVISIATHFGIEAKVIGHCEENAKKKVTLTTPEGEIVYTNH